MARHYNVSDNYQVTSHIAVILVVLILFLAVGYFFFLTGPDESVELVDMIEELEENQKLWFNERPDSYRYVMDRACDCPSEDGRPYLATEIDGALLAEFPVPVESAAGILLEAPTRPIWIDDLFDQIERTLRSGKPADVRYDPALGYPEYVILGSDEFEIRDFEVIGRR